VRDVFWCGTSVTARNDNDGFLDATFTSARPTLRVLNNRHLPSLSLASNFKDQVNNSCLSRRGWIFQERVFSRRILHFVQNHFSFEDKNGAKTSDVDGGRGQPLLYSHWEDKKLNIEDEFERAIEWHRVIQRYSPCLLTFDRDPLPAIAGLARYVKTHYGAGRYFLACGASPFIRVCFG
jgi:hypothetical protein